MAIPDYPELMQPVLYTLTETAAELPFERLMACVGSRLGLTAEEFEQCLPSGNETVLGNRLRWALAYLERAGLVQHDDGAWRHGGAGSGGVPAPSRASMAGAEATAHRSDIVIAAEARSHRQRLAAGLLGRIQCQPPGYFERLIIDLLLAMGYGCRRDLVRHLGGSGDGGIDGAVPQDVLGLDVIYIQAKRYRPGALVPVSAVREFAGSLTACKATKGVFVTTAAFPRSAWKFVTAAACTIALIDGEALADLLIGYNIGVRVRDIYEVKELDEAYLGGTPC